MKYQEPKLISREDALSAIASNDPAVMADALINLTHSDADGEFVRDICLRLVDGVDLTVAKLAIACLGHLARLHDGLNLHSALVRLEALRDDSMLGGTAEDALDDIAMYRRSYPAEK